MPATARIATHHRKRSTTGIVVGDFTEKNSSMLLIEDNFGEETECTAIINKKSSDIGKSRSNLASFELLPSDKMRIVKSLKRINLDESM